MTKGLAALSCPALVVWATEDRVMPIATGRELAAAIPTCRRNQDVHHQPTG
jgi:pimeloyl-ACP methyl ester carboxylesterase